MTEERTELEALRLENKTLRSERDELLVVVADYEHGLIEDVDTSSISACIEHEPSGFLACAAQCALDQLIHSRMADRVRARAEGIREGMNRAEADVARRDARRLLGDDARATRRLLQAIRRIRGADDYERSLQIVLLALRAFADDRETLNVSTLTEAIALLDKERDEERAIAHLARERSKRAKP